LGDAVTHRLHRCLQRCQWRAQVVADGGEEPAPCFVVDRTTLRRLLQVGRHPVDGVGEPPHLVGAVDAGSGVETAPGDR
jgi:hypothetical protein